MSYADYVDQLTYLLCLKMTDEHSRPQYGQPNPVYAANAWPTLPEVRRRSACAQHSTLGQFGIQNVEPGEVSHHISAGVGSR